MWSFPRPTLDLHFSTCQARTSLVYRIYRRVDYPRHRSPGSSKSGLCKFRVRRSDFFFGMNLLGVVAIVFVAAQYFATVLESELKRSEDLLLNILPPSIAKRLKQGDDPIVDNFDGVTILFADLVGFTKASASLDPNFLIRYLNDVFAAFDTIAESSSLEKIKTIGDAFAVGGLNDDTKDHAERVLDVAFDFRMRSSAESSPQMNLSFASVYTVGR